MDAHIDEKLAFFTSTIAADANAQAVKIMDEVQTESQQQLNTAEDEYLNEAYRYIKNEVSGIRTEARRGISHKLLENKRALFTLSQTMYEEVEKAVLDKLAVYTASEAYTAALIDALTHIVHSFGQEPVQVYLRKEDMDKAAVLQNALPTAQLTFIEGTFKLGGLLCQCPTRHWQVDDTFDTRYAELAKRFSALLGVQDETNKV